MHKVKATNMVNGYHITKEFVGNPLQVAQVMKSYLRKLIAEAKDVITDDNNSWSEEFWTIRVID